MMNEFVRMAPTISLLFFFLVFLGVAIWAFKPANKRRLQSYGDIPLHEEPYDGQ